MFPHNSSSHEISTETNAFVQNSKGDVVVLEESSLSGAREGERPEHARYCDIEFINSSMMAAPTSHPKATAANDFLTVLPRQSGELSFADGGEACQSVAPETIKNPTNHLLTYDNNDKIINHDNAEHNHHKYRKQNTPGSLGKLGSSADNSKSTCKLLSDNKDSFSVISIRVLMLSVRLNDTIGVDCCTAGVPSLVRIPKSDCPQRQLFHANLVDNYSLLGSRLYHGENNNVKANISLISNDSYNNNYNYNINNSKSVILLSSTSYGDYYYLNVTGDGFVGINAVGIPVILVDNNTASDCSRLNRMKLIGKICSVVTSKIIGETYAIGLLDNKIAAMSSLQQHQQHQQQLNYQFHYDSNNYKSALLSRAHKFTAINNASSSITLIVSKNEFTDHVIDNLQFFIDDNLTQVRELSPITSQYYYQLLLSHVTVNKLTQRICVPLLIKSKGYDKNNNNVANNSDYCNFNINYENGSDVKIFINENQDENYDQYDYTIMMNINGNNNQYVIEDIVNVAVCYKTSCVMTTNFSMLGSQNDGISRTEATIFTVGALSFQDNDKSNKPLNDSFKINKYQVSTKIGLESNYNYKSVSKSTPSVKYSDKSETSHQARLDVSDYEEQVKCVRSPVNIPTLTTCEPTMTLKSQSATVTSQTLTVPVSSRLNIENKSNNSSDSNATIRSKFITTNNNNNNNNNNNKNNNNNRSSSSNNNNKNLINYSNEKKSYNDMNYESNNEQVNENINERENSDARPFTRNWARLIAYVRALIPAYHEAYKNNESKCESQRNELKKALHSLFGDNNKIINDTQYDPIIDYKKRWGIPIILSLAGGGESSLNSGGGTNWGSAQATTPNNNNANPSGWGGTPGNAPPPPSNWGTNNVNRPVTGNPNQNQNQGPPGNQTNTTTVNKANNPNQASNSQTGPPTVQPSNPVQPNQNQGTQWPQGKPNPTVVPGQNPPTPNNNGNNVQQPPVVPCPLPGSNGNNNQVANSPQGSTTGGNSPPSNPNPSTKQQLEQLNTMREALFSQDGWGCQHVNQDTNWDVPASPEPSMNKDGVPMWKPPVNNGTDLWEANLRNGGQPPPPQQAKTPWGHTPSTNIGGTWGEDDDTADSSNMWTGAPTPTQPNTAQWPGAANNQTGSSWGDPRIDPRDPRDIRSVDPREMRDPRDHRMSMDPREHLRPMDPMARDPRMADMRGDPRGISGRLNGASADAMWGQPPGPPHHQMGHQHPSGPPAKMLNPSSMNQWTAPPPKDMMPGKPSGWEEPSPPTQRRNVPNYDDGTSLWGNPAANQRTMPTNKVSHWKDLPTPNLGRGGMQCPPGMPQNRMPGQPMKPDVGGPMWGHPGGPSGRNGSWGEGPHDTSNWDEPKTPASWNEQPLNPASWGGPTGHKPKAMGPTASWGETDMEQGPSWGHPAKTVLTKEVIWNSREFRYLCDLGYKKEDVETALRNREMNRDEAQELLSQLRSLDWRRHETPSGYDPTNQSSMSGAYPKFSHVAQQMSFPPGECLAARPSGAGTGSVGGSVASASLLKLQQQQQQQAAVQLQPPQQPNANPPQPPFNQASRTPQNPPSTQQLRMLVQQIQLAVQEGYLNQQILNQPLAPPTLILLNQLLQQIKVLQQLHQQHSVQSSLKGNSQTVLQISVQITKTKQQIANLQNQIAVQQATYMKQQAQQQQQHPAAPSQSSDYYNKSSLHDPMSAIQNSFSDLTMNKEPPVSQQQSRLNQWKLPSLDKDGDITGNEFSRAPGSSSKPPQTPVGLSHTHSSPNMNPLLGQGDGTWSTRLGDSGWPDAGNNDATDGKDWQPGSAAFSDLVPEFEPGKPWKGTQMKNIEDDPSITPGSVVRSLSLAAIKDPDTIFSSSTKTSPPPQSQNVDTSIPSLSNSTWSFNPPATTPSAFSSSKNTWTDSAPPPTAVTSELWGAPMNKARQGPPPGLSSKGVGGNTSNGWALGGVSRSSSSWALQSGGGGGGGGSNAGWLVAGTWLLLKNLTPQIDGSTLKTLCMQHGPVQDFRLYLNHGIALTKYSSRDEASKAQGALNNCVLGNTTIFAESPADSEVHTLLQQLSHGGQQQTGTSGGSGWGLRPSNKAGPPPDTWGGSSSQLWGAPPSTNSLWSNSGIDSGDAQRTTPSSLSYLPGDLLGGESM